MSPTGEAADIQALEIQKDGQKQCYKMLQVHESSVPQLIRKLVVTDGKNGVSIIERGSR